MHIGVSWLFFIIAPYKYSYLVTDKFTVVSLSGDDFVVSNLLRGFSERQR